MTEPVKPKRRYDSPRRREQAAATRREILDAAQRLFEQQGYAATTMAAIAAEAGVALKTVYVAFETKSGVLRALWHLLLRGDERRRAGRRADVVPRGPRGARPGAPAAPQRAQRARRQAAHRGALLEVIRSAAAARPRHRGAVEPHPVRLLRQPARDRASACTRKGALRRGLDVARATRHPLDAQPPGPVAAARRRARLDAGAVGGVVRRDVARSAAS